MKTIFAVFFLFCWLQINAAVESLTINTVPIANFHNTIQTVPPPGSSLFLQSPAYTWSFGSFNTSAAMLMGYYDSLPSTHWPNIYTGPGQVEHPGVMPPYNNIPEWGAGDHGSLGQCPLSASKIGLDGQAERGHVDDYFIIPNSTDDDPNGNIEHLPKNCIGDFTGSNQKYWNCNDGETKIYFNDDGTQLADYSTCETQTTRYKDGCHGLKDFIESCGYGGSVNYSQTVIGVHGNTNGFSFTDYKNQIDDCYPVLLHFKTMSGNPTYACTIIGYGYSDDVLYDWVWYYDTWDSELHYFEYDNNLSTINYGTRQMNLYGVTVFRPGITVPNATSYIRLDNSNMSLYISPETVQPFTVTYFDEDTNGQQMINCTWDIDLFYQESDYTMSFNYMEGTTTGYHSSTWAPFLNDLPIGLHWKRNIDGSIMGTFNVHVSLLDGSSYYLTRYIHLSYPPDAPQIVSVTQVDDALQLELGADGATSYRVYYDTDAGVPYNGAGALEGQSPVFFNAWDDIKLTGLAPGMQWYIAIKAVNSAGESPISNEYLYNPANTSAIIDQNISWTNNLTLTHPVDIVSSGRLSIDPNVVITLADEGRIICQAGGVLQLDNYVTIKGQRLTIPQDETNPQEIPGNRVEVHGGLISGTGVSFDSFEGNYWDGLYIDSPYTVVLNQMSFNNCRLVKEQETISINNSVFDNASISCRNASLIVDNCQISGEVYCLNSENINISNTSVTGYGNGIELSECTNYEISNCQITNNTGNGINVYETNGAYNVIQRCTISMNAGDGIKFYHANGNVISCTINGNNKGVVVFQNSVVNINKEPGTDPNMYDSYISNNTWQEILFTDNCNVIMDGGWNQIIDMQYTHGTFDQYLVQCPNLNHSIYFKENYWGYHNSNVNEEPIIPPSERFFPENIISDEGEPGYILDPVWSPGLPHIITDENDELIYQQAIDLAVAEDVEGAIYLFKQIISLYPDSKLLDACAKNLYALEQDKQALKDYYHTEPNLHWNGEIDKIADYLETYCNIKLGNYQEAIEWFEAIISNPPSELDSLMAVIDLGYTYVLMQENAPKTAVTRMYPSLQPRSRKSFEQNRDALLFCLYTGATGNELPDNNIDNGIAVPMLNNCYPNPFNPTTTISYLLPYEMLCDLSIYNIRGQKVKTLVTDMQPAGLHKVVWDGTDRDGRIVSSGIYLYRLTSPVKSITNKMIMLK